MNREREILLKILNKNHGAEYEELDRFGEWTLDLKVQLDDEEASLIEELRSVQTCSHCLRELNGFASINDFYLCHPDDENELDCYQRVQMGHSMPCVTCIARVKA